MDCILKSGRRLALLAIVMAGILFVPQIAHASSYSKELRINMPAGVKYATTTFSADLTHDGKADAVRVVPTMKNTRSGSDGIRVYVKGNKALTVKSGLGNARFSVYYVHMSKKLEFLAIAQPRGKRDAFTPGKLLLYKYSKKKLVQVANLSQKWGAIGTPSHSAVRSAKKGSVTVTATFEKSPLGARSYLLVYSYDKSAKGFSLATASARPVVAPGHWTASVTRALYKKAAPKKIKMVRTVVKDPTAESGIEPVTTSKTYYVKNKKVATMKKGAKVTAVRVHKDGYVKVKLSNGKSGWFKWAKYKKGKPFKEVGAGY